MFAPPGPEPQRPGLRCHRLQKARFPSCPNPIPFQWVNKYIYKCCRGKCAFDVFERPAAT